MNLQQLEQLKWNFISGNANVMDNLHIFRYALSECNNSTLSTTWIRYGDVYPHVYYGFRTLSDDLFLDCLNLIIHNRQYNKKHSVTWRNAKYEMMKNISHRINEGLM